MGVAREVNCIEVAAEADRCSCGPDLARIRRPGKALHTTPPFAEQSLLSRQIHDCHITSIVANEGVVEKSDQVPFGRNAQMTDPAICFVQEFADGILEA